MLKNELSEKHHQASENEIASCAEQLPAVDVSKSLSSRRYIEDEKNMFVQVGRCVNSRFDTCLLESESALDEYLNTDTSTARRDSYSGDTEDASQPAGRFFLLDPTFGWGRLQITQNGMSKIAKRYEIFPSFFKYLKVFGEKDFARDEGFGGYEAITHRDVMGKAKTIESCFLWKYVEPGGLEGRYPHSIRQAFIYQKFDVDSKRSTNILVRIPEKLAAQIKDALTSTNGENEHLLDTWTGLQIMCARSGTDEWRNFINYLDNEVSKLFDDLILSGTNATTNGAADRLQSRLTNMKKLQFFIDQLLRAAHMLDLNKSTISAMLRAFKRRSEILEDLREMQHSLEDNQQEYEFLQKMAKNVLDRAVMLSHELRDTVALRNHEINKQSNDSTSEGTHAIVELSRKSAYEARVVKILSVVAVVYLPASFAADFLQMGYVFVTEDGNFRVHATVNLWLYAIFAIPLLVLTVLIYVVFEMLSRRKAKRRAYLLQNVQTEVV